MASDPGLEEALRRAGSVEGVVKLFHEMARVAFALYGTEIANNEHIRGLISEQLSVASANVFADSEKKTGDASGMDRHPQPSVHPSRQQNLRPGAYDQHPKAPIPHPTSATGANVLAVGLPDPFMTSEKAARKAGRAARKAERASKFGTVPESKTEILELLLDDRHSLKLLNNPGQDAAFTRILFEGLKARCEQYNAPITYQGRSPAGIRFNFDLTADGLPAMLGRLFSTSSQNRQGLQDRLEAAMKIFVRWNPEMFPELNRGNGKYSRITSGSLTSTLEILRLIDGLGAVPVKPEHWPNFCWQLLNTIKKRIMVKCPSSHLLQYTALPGTIPTKTKAKKKAKKTAREAQWSLSAPTPAALQHGFYGKLTAHLNLRGPDMTAERLEANLDLEVYKLAMRDPKAWPELFDADVEIEDTEGDRERDSDAGGVAISEDEEDHDMEDGASEGDTDAQMVIDDEENSVAQPPSPPPAARRQTGLVCMFHLQGRCPWGDQCTADHP